MSKEQRKSLETIIRAAQANFDHLDGEVREIARQFNKLAEDITAAFNALGIEYNPDDEPNVSANNVPSSTVAFSGDHDDLSGVSANDHHNQSHTQTDHDAAEAADIAAVGTAAAAGTSTETPNADHVHAHEAGHVVHDTVWDAAGDLVVGTAADTAARLAIGATAGALRVVAGTAAWDTASVATPVASTADGTATAGTSANPSSHDDHKHGLVSYASAAASVGTAAAGTIATAPSRGDHVHPTGAGTPTTQAFGDAPAVGAGPAASMTDHKHGMMAAPTISSLGAAPSTVDYLVGTADAGLSAEIVVGTSPGGELGGTWASPTVDASHSGSTHAATQAAAEATAAAANTADIATHAGLADPHAGYVLESLLNAKGDLITASADNTPALLTVGADDTILMADTAAAGGLKWVASASPSAVGTAAATGTADTFTRGDHVHAHEAAHINHDTTWAAAGDLIVGTANDTAAVLPVGTAGQVLTVAAGTASWAAASGGSGSSTGANLYLVRSCL